MKFLDVLLLSPIHTIPCLDKKDNEEKRESKDAIEKWKENLWKRERNRKDRWRPKKTEWGLLAECQDKMSIRFKGRKITMH